MYLDVMFEVWREREKTAACGNQFIKLAEKEKWQKLARKMGHQSLSTQAEDKACHKHMHIVHHGKQPLVH